MRLFVLVLVCCSIACRTADLPSIEPVDSPNELTADDLAILEAGIEGTIRGGLVRSGHPNPSATILLGDRTLRICVPPAWDRDCVLIRDPSPASYLTRQAPTNRTSRSLLIPQPPAPGIMLASFSEFFASVRIRDRAGWRTRFLEKYRWPQHHAQLILVTAPAYVGDKAVLYVNEYGQSAVWIELSRVGGRWVVSETLDGWQS